MFPLLRATYCVQKVILCLMTPIDLFHLSQTSKRAEKIMDYSAMRRLKLELEFDGVTNIGNFLVRRDNVSYYFFAVNFNDDGQLHINEKDVNFHCFIHCNDVLEKVISLLDYFRTVFRLKLSTLIMSSIDKQTFNSITDVIITQQTKLELLKLKNIGGPALDITELLQKVETVDTLWIDSKLKSGFKFQLNHFPHQAAFRKANWFTRHHLFSPQWEKLLVTGAPLTNKAISDFVDKWMLGNFPKLKFVAVVSDKFQNRTAVTGRVPPIFDPNFLPLDLLNLRTIDEWELSVNLNIGIDITNKDGMTAKFAFKGGAEPMFFLYVCD